MSALLTHHRFASRQSSDRRCASVYRRSPPRHGEQLAAHVCLSFENLYSVVGRALLSSANEPLSLSMSSISRGVWSGRHRVDLFRKPRRNFVAAGETGFEFGNDLLLKRRRH